MTSWTFAVLGCRLMGSKLSPAAPTGRDWVYLTRSCRACVYLWLGDAAAESRWSVLVDTCQRCACHPLTEGGKRDAAVQAVHNKGHAAVMSSHVANPKD